MAWFRHPRTLQARRESQDGYVRAARNIHNLPTSWDDISVRPQRSWKVHRDAQWRPVASETLATISDGEM